MSNGCADVNLTNPMPAGQIVHADFDWLCLTPPEGIGISVNASNKSTCITSELLIQGLAGAICTALAWDDLELRCLEVSDASNHKIVLQAIIDKACGYTDPNCPTCPEEESECCEVKDPDGNDVPNTFELLNGMNYCIQDSWTVDADPSEDCITPVDVCGPNPTTEEMMQAIISRVISLEKELRKKCELIDTLEGKVDNLQLELDSNDCCNNNLQAQVTANADEIVNIKNDCCE